MTHSLPKQAFALRSMFPGVKATLKPTRLVWTGPIQPTFISRVYTIQIVYRLGRFPEARVLRPQLESRPGEALPHCYQDGTLCLHQPDEWTPDMLIANTTVPWTSEWLINYEIWKATGEWYGGGQWPPARTVADEAKSSVEASSEREWKTEMPSDGSGLGHG